MRASQSAVSLKGPSQPSREPAPRLSKPAARVIDANVSFYRQIAQKYDSCEGYLFDRLLEQNLEDDLDIIGSYFASLERTPCCLECGGGTGRLTLKMCARGWKVTVVDVSKEMLTSLKAKALAMGFSPTLINAPIEGFLEEADETYDLVAFSAVLHHLYSYTHVAELAASILCSGGIFYSIHDPVVPNRPFCTRAFDSLDIAIAKITFDPSDVFPGIGRRIRKVFSTKDSMFGRAVVSAGDIAEFHAGSGVDDLKLVQLLRKRGFAILEHKRFATGRTTLVRFLNESLRLLESFKIIARRSPDLTPGVKFHEEVSANG